MSVIIHTSNQWEWKMNQLVQVQDGKMTVSSKQVADHFGKVHRDVMRDIRNLIENAGVEFGSENFAQSSYTSLQNKELPCYLLTRDGFSLLAMGFTGKKAIEWKVKYIKAFNEMEAALINGSGVMQKLNDAMKLMEEDKAIASACGKGLSSWKELRKEHMERVDKLCSDVQLLLNFRAEK